MYCIEGGVGRGRHCPLLKAHSHVITAAADRED